MIVLSDWCVDVVAWAALFFYFACFIPQIIENYRIKSTRGLSKYSMVAYFFGYFAVIYYIFCLDLILPYKIVVPMEFAAMAVIVGQRFYYDGLFTDMTFFYGILGSTIFTLMLAPVAFYYPMTVGAVCGWLSLALFIAHPIPQVVKNFRERSVEGFSFGFVTLLAIAVTCELIVALVRGLPLQTLCMALKGLFFYIIFCVQFWLYWPRRKYQTTIVEEFIADVIEPVINAEEGDEEHRTSFPVSQTPDAEKVEEAQEDY